MIKKTCTRLISLPKLAIGYIFGIVGALLFLVGPVNAASVTGTATVTISASAGGVGAVVETPAVTAPVVDTTTTGEVALPTGGDVVSILTSTFREVATVPQAVVTAPAPGAAAVSTGATTDSSNVSARFSQGSRAAAQIFGGASSVAVSGVANQTYNINLPGQTSYSTGSENVQIAGFEHNAGATPQLSSSGSGVFSVAAQLGGGDGAASTDSDAGPAADAGDVGSVQQILATPVVTQSPYVGITVSYN